MTDVTTTVIVEQTFEIVRRRAWMIGIACVFSYINVDWLVDSDTLNLHSLCVTTAPFFIEQQDCPYLDIYHDVGVSQPTVDCSDHHAAV